MFIVKSLFLFGTKMSSVTQVVDYTGTITPLYNQLHGHVYLSWVQSGGVATTQAIEEAKNDPAGPRTPVLVPRFITVPEAPKKSKE